MERFEHGGDIYTHPGVIDFSANLNPAGIPPAARAVLRESIDAYAAYPDPHCRALREALAGFEGVPEAWVLPCAGASDGLARLCRVLHPRTALLCAPSYAGYEQALEQVGGSVVWHQLGRSDGFAVTTRLAEAITEGIDLVFLANPNNPTGRCLDRKVLDACLARAAKVGATVILDECFIDLTEGIRSNDLLAHHPQLVIVKAHTKTFALAGLRLGYVLCANKRLMDALEAAGQPWAVSVPAQLAGVASLTDEGYLTQSRRLVARERDRLRAALVSCGFAPVPSDANYLLFSGPCDLGQRLLARGLLVRSCDNYPGLGAGWFRIAVRTPAENDLLIAALKEVCV